MEGREKNAETQAGCHRHVLHRILAAASPKRKCDRLFQSDQPCSPHTPYASAVSWSIGAERSHQLSVLWPQFWLIAACCRLILVLSPVLAFWDCRQRQR